MSMHNESQLLPNRFSIEDTIKNMVYDTDRHRETLSAVVDPKDLDKLEYRKLVLLVETLNYIKRLALLL